MIDLLNLPPNLHFFRASQNQFEGEISIQSLPDSLVVLGLTGNDFSGPIDLRHQNGSIRMLELPQMRITGDASVTLTSRRLEVIDMSANKMDGTFAISSDAKCIQAAIFPDNKLCGVLQLLDFPKSLVIINLGNNAFENEVLRVGPIPLGLKALYLEECGVERCLQENGNPVEDTKDFTIKLKKDVLKPWA